MGILRFVFFLLCIAYFIVGCQAGISPETGPKSGDLTYYGHLSGEAELTFDFFVRLESSRAPSKAQVTDALEAQVDHLFGTMAANPLFAAPKTNHEFLHVGKPEKISDGVYQVSYSYRGDIVVKSGPRTHYEVILPFNPETIYEASRVGKHYPCTDPYYDGDSDFWYFWSPDRDGCELVEGVDYGRIAGRIVRKPNTVRTYPKYEELVREEQGEKVISVQLLMGMDDPDEDRDPNRSADENAKVFQKVKRHLLAQGFKTSGAFSAEAVEELVGVEFEEPPYYELFSRQGKRARTEVGIFFGPSGMEEDSEAFHHFLKRALERSSLVIYDGHSGLGGHLDLKEIEKAERFKIRLPSERYQIYFFNSCSSYPYYNVQFFHRKAVRGDRKGIKNLEILTNGLEAAFDSGFKSTSKLVRALTDWSDGKRTTSYQDLIKEMDAGELLGVNGDEDNPTSVR